MNEKKYDELKEIARQSRVWIIKALAESNSGHPGGSLSAIDILTYLYFEAMNIDPKNPHDPDRDRLVMCKGHAAPALYTSLALRGYFDPNELLTLRKLGSRLQGHPDTRKLPGVDASTGSLGQGLSIANGMALAAKLDEKDYFVYAILGDGETQEGQVWEALMTASHYQLNNVIAFLDYNHLQIDGRIEDVKSGGNFASRFRSFGWHVLEIDGHDFKAIDEAVKAAKQELYAPSMIIAHTVKGKGVSFMEGQVGWHGKAPNQEETKEALRLLGAVEEEV
ncbi:MAG TPA: transketolase [Firmicutes bacterium]|jgi:transketolase|nr:transketolase [Bacillota bacterium]